MLLAPSGKLPAQQAVPPMPSGPAGKSMQYKRLTSFTKAWVCEGICDRWLVQDLPRIRSCHVQENFRQLVRLKANDSIQMR